MYMAKHFSHYSLGSIWFVGDEPKDNKVASGFLKLKQGYAVELDEANPPAEKAGVFRQVLLQC